MKELGIENQQLTATVDDWNISVKQSSGLL